MKGWKETTEILARMARLDEAGGRAALATVVRIEGSAYRRPGAKLLVEEDRTTRGSVSGGCLEANVRETALAVIRQGTPRLLYYDTGSDDHAEWGMELGCNGAIDIFVQPAVPSPAIDLLKRALQLLEAEQPFAVSTIVRDPTLLGRMLLVCSDGAVVGSLGDADLDRRVSAATTALLARGQTSLYDIGSSQVFTEVKTPPPRLIVCGAGEDARPLVSYASDAGFAVTVVDRRMSPLSVERFPGARRRLQLTAEDGLEPLGLDSRTFVVIKTHSLAYDREWLRRFLPTNVQYIGLLGPRSRTEEILRQIGAEGRGRVYGPVGLDLGAEGAEQIALSIVAELLAVHAGRQPGHLREKRIAVHAS
jgi:xanthine dehydrogenase accessory factor